MLQRRVRVIGALLRAGFANALVYRAEFLVWMLTTNLPLVNLALWSAVARDGSVQGTEGSWSQRQFAAYFLSALLVRVLTSCGTVWELTYEIKQGTLALRLLRPVHPLLAYATEALSPLPIRMTFALPIVAALLLGVGWEHLSHDPLSWLLVPVAIAGVWLMVFLVMCLVGALGFWFDSAAGVWEGWFAFYTVLSGYAVPLDLFPAWLRSATAYLPFRLMLALPVEAMTGRIDHLQLLHGIAQQVAWCTALLLLARATFASGLRRYATFGA